MPKRGGRARRTAATKDQVNKDGTKPRQAPQPADSPHVLDWSGAGGSSQNFVDAACLLYFLCKQLREDADDDSDHERDADGEDDQHDEISDEEVVPCDSQTGDNQDQDQERLQLAESRLRNRFLDRLAEVLARIKGSPDEVASAYMVEVEDDKGNQRAEVRIAKNEGLSERDRKYLKKLGATLEQVARGGKSATS